MSETKKYANMTEEERRDFGFRQLCRRILDINPECSWEKGCPVHYAALPMLTARREQLGFKNLNDAPEAFRRMITADGQGRVCEIGEIQFWAREYLK